MASNDRRRYQEDRREGQVEAEDPGQDAPQGGPEAEDA